MGEKKLKIAFIVVLFFAVLFNAAPKVFASSTKAEYTMKKDKVVYRDNNEKVRGVVYYQYPKIKGDTAAVEKINKLLKSKSEAFMKSESAQSIKDTVEYHAKDGSFYPEDVQYFYKTICKATYNNNSILSLHMKECWYAGGVYNQTDYGYIFDLNSGEQLEIEDVVSGDDATIKSKILKAAKKYLTSDGDFDQSAYELIKSNDFGDYKFYVSKGKVSICYGSYELGRGNGWDIFWVKGKYH
ncbi:MAG: hypothetical protein PWP24_486 [Clostridiales bacterium]|nr:hypothetical protein [Clostridiales bacterium]